LDRSDTKTVPAADLDVIGATPRLESPNAIRYDATKTSGRTGELSKTLPSLKATTKTTKLLRSIGRKDIPTGCPPKVAATPPPIRRPPAPSPPPMARMTENSGRAVRGAMLSLCSCKIRSLKLRSGVGDE